MRIFRFGALPVALAMVVGSWTASTAATRTTGAATHVERHAHAKIGMVVAYAKNDHGFNQSGIEGLNQAKNQLHADVNLTVAFQNSEFESDLASYAQQGYVLTVAVGDFFSNAIYQAATQYPKSHFVIVDGEPVDNSGHPAKLKNVAEVFFKPEQPGYLVGVLAGLVEKSRKGPAKHNTIGTLGGVNIPFVNGLMCGYYEGARSVDKKVKLAWDYAGSFTDATKGEDLGNKQVQEGADILFQVADISGFGYLKAANDHHKYGIGFISDESALGSFMLTTATIKVNVAVFRTIRSAVQGKFSAGPTVYGIENGGVGIAKSHMHHVPVPFKKILDADAKKLRSGAITPKASCKLPASA